MESDSAFLPTMRVSENTTHIHIDLYIDIFHTLLQIHSEERCWVEEMIFQLFQGQEILLNTSLCFSCRWACALPSTILLSSRALICSSSPRDEHTQMDKALQGTGKNYIYHEIMCPVVVIALSFRSKLDAPAGKSGHRLVKVSITRD